MNYEPPGIVTLGSLRDLGAQQAKLRRGVKVRSERDALALLEEVAHAEVGYNGRAYVAVHLSRDTWLRIQSRAQVSQSP
jgi:hypothetical protein